MRIKRAILYVILGMSALAFCPSGVCLQQPVSPEQRIINCKAHILFDTWFSIATHTVQKDFLQTPVIHGSLGLLTAAGRILTGNLSDAKNQTGASLKNIGTGLHHHKASLLKNSLQLGVALWLKGHAASYINREVVPVPKAPSQPLKVQAAHTVAPLLANCLLFDAYQHAQHKPTLANFIYLGAMGTLHYHHPQLLDTYILKTKKQWSQLDKQLALAQNVLPTALSNAACGPI